VAGGIPQASSSSPYPDAMTDDPMRDLIEEATTTVATGGDMRRAVGLVSLLSLVTTSVAAVTAGTIALVVFLIILSPFAFLLGFGLLLG